MGTKMALAFSVIFMADIEKWLLMVRPYKPLVWKRFVDDTFSLWDISTKDVYNFVDFANTFHPTNIKFTCEISSECTIFLDTEVLQGPRLSTHIILDLQTQFKPTETFQYTHFSSCRRSNCEKGRGETLHLLRTNSVRENSEQSKWDFENTGSVKEATLPSCLRLPV